MAKTRDEIQTLVEANLGRTDKTSSIIAGIEFGLEDISQSGLIQKLQAEADLAVSEGDSSVSLPSDFESIYNLRWVGENFAYPIQVKSKKWIEDRWPSVDLLGESRPCYAWVDGGELGFVPKAGMEGTLKLRYYKIPTMSSGSSECPIRGAEEALVCYATSYVFESLEEYDQATRWMARYQQKLLKLWRSNKRRAGKDAGFSGWGDEAQRPAIEPYLDPFAGHGTTGFGR